MDKNVMIAILLTPIVLHTLHESSEIESLNGRGAWHLWQCLKARQKTKKGRKPGHRVELEERQSALNGLQDFGHHSQDDRGLGQGPPLIGFRRGVILLA